MAVAVKRTGDAANAVTRIPGGHPEGFLEAFANLYRDFADQVEAFPARNAMNDSELLVPTVSEGVKGVLFVEKAVASSESSRHLADHRFLRSGCRKAFWATRLR